ncbi:DNA-directed RNA polymerase I subunit RPA43 [Gouania willdenowi]|uniref:DNA-directed RNA polymerase subunit n=1 Tax=Gouania willdenowi TaxID=441366 RepID=A0A8C5NDK6_GOUWI|nr:DNA-directed RNA polymerase I subunit RPA43 [Gouania willdenowi]
MANLKHAEEESKHVDVCGETPAVQPPVPAASEPAALHDIVGAVPSFAAALELLSAPYSCLVMTAHRRHVALPPVYLRKKRTGIQEELEAELLRFSHRMNGVPLAYDNIKIVGQHGDIYDDSGYIHMDVEANFIVFKPTECQKLQGTVNKLGVNHVGCLVHGCFNASIPKPNIIPVETWRDAGPRIGTELEFEVTALDADSAGVLLIRGRLDHTRVQQMLALSESSESTVADDQTETQEAEPTPDPGRDDPEDAPKKKKKKKKDKVKEEETEISLPKENGTDETDSQEPSKKKKRKKEKREEEEIERSLTEIHGSDSSGYISDKSRKKRKHETDNDLSTSLSEDPEAIKPKKKKKRS